MKHFADEILVPLNACTRSVKKAREYSTLQEAWDNWDRGDDMLWLLWKLEADPLKQIHCACDIAERVLPIFEKKYPDDKRPREAIEAARRYADDPSNENRRKVRAAASAAWDAAGDARWDARDAWTASAASAAGDARSVADERKAQTQIVRKYFPELPIKKRNQ